MVTLDGGQWGQTMQTPTYTWPSTKLHAASERLLTMRNTWRRMACCSSSLCQAKGAVWEQNVERANNPLGPRRHLPCPQAPPPLPRPSFISWGHCIKLMYTI